MKVSVNKMRNKMVMIVGAIVILFVALYFVNDYKNKKALDVANNPYKKDTLRQETIDQLNDPLYGNIIVPDDLDAMLEAEEDVTVYYYSPTCVYCQQTTPIIVPITEELGVDMKKMNLLEFDKMKYYDIEGTPTVIHYEKGVEVGRLSGAHSAEEYRSFFDEYVLKK